MSIKKTEDPELPYLPTALEAEALEMVNDDMELSAKYWNEIHTVQRRLYRRYRNEKLKDRVQANILLGRAHYIADIIHSVLAGSLMEQVPWGRVSATGFFNEEEAQIIDRVHGIQQSNVRIYNAVDNAILNSVVTGTGFVIPGWTFQTKNLYRNTPETFPMVNPDDPTGPTIDMPTGRMIQSRQQVARNFLDAVSIPPWDVYPTPGAKDEFQARSIAYVVKRSRRELFELQASGEIHNVEYIPHSAFGVPTGQTDMNEQEILSARREDDNYSTDEESIYLVYWYGPFNLNKYHNDIDLQTTEEFPCRIIKPLQADVILDIDMNSFYCGEIPGVRFPYMGDSFFGMSPIMVAERLLVHDEDIFNYIQDAATRELYRKIFVPKGISMAEMNPLAVDQMVSIPEHYAREGVYPKYEERPPQIMINMMNQSKTAEQVLDELTAVYDFARGQSLREETATKTAQRSQFLQTRFKKRMIYFEKTGMSTWTQWQTILNAQFLSDEDVSRMWGRAVVSPFKKVIPIIPVDSYDYYFEGSRKTADDPIKAQILRSILADSLTIPPGMDEKGRFIQLNPMVIFRELLRRLNVVEDIEKFFMPLPPEVMPLLKQKMMEQQAMMMMQNMGIQEGPTGTEDGAGDRNRLGAIDQGKMLSALGNKENDISMEPGGRKE